MDFFGRCIIATGLLAITSIHAQTQRVFQQGVGEYNGFDNASLLTNTNGNNKYNEYLVGDFFMAANYKC